MRNIQVIDASVEFSHQPFKKPLQLSTGPITEITEAVATVTVRDGGKTATGKGSIFLSDLWSWPDPALTHEVRDAALRELSCDIAKRLPAHTGDEAAHPLELGMRLHDAVCHASHQAEGRPPILARAMCASPFDAAIHDAAGALWGESAFDFYSDGQALPSVDALFGAGGAAKAISEAIQQPASSMDAWIIVGARDNIIEDVGPWVHGRGYRCFKLKLLARDNAEDVARTVEVYRGVRELGVQQPRLTVDTNEANPSADAVLDYLERLRAADAGAFEALEYLEQPTGRDITRFPFDWRAVTKLKPVLLDEGLTAADLMQTAREQGWSGFALKTCKGHSFALVAAAWARRNGMTLALQNLTNPGLSMIHAALFAAHIPMRNGIELNSPQYAPAANAAWLPRLAGLFDPHDGRHVLSDPHPIGLGSRL